MRIVIGLAMDKFINDRVLSLLPGHVSASCDAANEYQDTGAHGYSGKSDIRPGIITSRKAGEKPCRGAGGYRMSIRDFVALIPTALHADRLLSLQARNEMYREPTASDDRLAPFR